MTEIAIQLLAKFESLDPRDRHEFLTQVLRRSDDFPVSAISDNELSNLADELFQSLDAQESNGDET